MWFKIFRMFAIQTLVFDKNNICQACFAKLTRTILWVLFLNFCFIFIPKWLKLLSLLRIELICKIAKSIQFHCMCLFDSFKGNISIHKFWAIVPFSVFSFAHWDRTIFCLFIETEPSFVYSLRQNMDSFSSSSWNVCNFLRVADTFYD